MLLALVLLDAYCDSPSVSLSRRRLRAFHGDFGFDLLCYLGVGTGSGVYVWISSVSAMAEVRACHGGGDVVAARDDMEKEERNQRACKSSSMEPEFFLQWGNKKRLRCVRVKDPQKLSQKSNGVVRRRITSRIDRCLVSEKEGSNRLTRNSEAAILRSGSNENRKSSSPEKEDRYYTTRGSVVGDENGKVSVDANNGEDNKLLVWPKLYITLSNKEKEEDFLAMKGCKPPQRPKKRAKLIQRSLLLVSPGAWLTDMCQERYEVREKKSSKKRPRGLKAMGSMESDSE